MNLSLALKYLSGLRDNNNREWYAAHKPENRAANAEFEAALQELIFRLAQTDDGLLRFAPRELTFKLNRDTRFSHDKSPYNPAFRAHISPCGKLPVPVGYYIVIKPGMSFLGGGLFADMFKDATKMVRDAIAARPDEWLSLINAPEFKENFTVRGSALKNVPADYDKESPAAEFLKNKSWYIEYPISDEIIADADSFIDLAAGVFEKMKPFNDYLNRVLEGFKMPERGGM